jgi:4'-phosphopantetheinyl transferase EntD
MGAETVRLHDLEQTLGENLGTPVIIVCAKEEVDPARLHQAERKRLSEFRFERRKRDWLLGRNALKEILPMLGGNEDTTGKTFPGSRVSLTHAGHTAYAAAATQKDRGIGIDYEPRRDIDTRAARWFLDHQELQWLNIQPESVRSAELVRLWTIKEAAYKSHPNNREMTLSDFVISEPSAHVSDVITGGPRIKVTSEACGSGHLSVAVFGEQ